MSEEQLCGRLQPGVAEALSWRRGIAAWITGPNNVSIGEAPVNRAALE